MTGKFKFSLFVEDRIKKVLAILFGFLPYFFLGVLVLVLYYLRSQNFITDNIFRENPILILVLVGSLLFFGVSTYFIYEILPGNFNGDIVFDKSGITIGRNFYSLEDIKNIEIIALDYFGKRKWQDIDPLYGHRCQGINNYVNLEFHRGETMSSKFKIEYEGEIRLLKPILNEYLEKGKISLENVNELLKL